MNSSTTARRLLTLLLVAAAGGVSACDTPTTPTQTRGVASGAVRTTPTPKPTVTPTPTPTPSPSPEPVMVQFLGAVTDEDGTPLIGASVETDYTGAKGQFAWNVVNTIDGGRYSMHVPARPNSPVYGLAGTLAVMWAWQEGYDYNLQLVGGSAAENHVDFRLVRPRRIDAGGSVTVAIEQDSSLCADLDVNFNVKSRCENVYISAATAGTLTIEARSVSPGGVVPIVQTGYYPVSAAPGVLSLQVKAGQSYWIRLEVPIEAAPQQYLVLTTMQSSIR